MSGWMQRAAEEAALEQERVGRLDERLDELEAENARLREELDEAKRNPGFLNIALDDWQRRLAREERLRAALEQAINAYSLIEQAAQIWIERGGNYGVDAENYKHSVILIRQAREIALSPQPSAEYDRNYGDERECTCGHEYYRHFDTYDGMRTVGCKYCDCDTFMPSAEAPPACFPWKSGDMLRAELEAHQPESEEK